MSVAELRSLHFVRQEGWQPSYLVTPAGRKVSRVNVIGILVGTYSSIFIATPLLAQWQGERQN